MKKSIATLAAVAALAGTACSHAGSEERAFQWTAELPAGAVVHLRNGSGTIEVRRSSSQGAEVIGNREWRRGRARDVNFVVTQNGNDYYLCAMWRNSGRCGASGYRGKNTGGLLAMFSLFNRTTDATADLIATLPANVVVDARNTSGDVTVDGITGGVNARSVNGDVTARNAGGKITLATTNGDLVLDADLSAPMQEVSLNTTNGDIRASLPAAAEGAFDLSTVNGDLRCDFPLEQASKSPVTRHLRGQIGASSRAVKMRSVNGSVVVTRAGVAEHE